MNLMPTGYFCVCVFCFIRFVFDSSWSVSEQEINSNFIVKFRYVPHAISQTEHTGGALSVDGILSIFINIHYVFYN